MLNMNQDVCFEAWHLTEVGSVCVCMKERERGTERKRKVLNRPEALELLELISL